MKVTQNVSRRSAGGFTLIELLTVIAIIGILAAILIPTVGAVREKAKQAQCASNLRDWGRVLMLYANENKNRYAIMERITKTDGSQANQYWFQIANDANNTLYARYFGQTRGDITRFASCPSQGGTGGSSLLNTHYLMTRPSLDVGGTPLAANLVEISKIRTPSKYVLMVERAFASNDAVDTPVNGGDYENMQLTNSNARTNANGFIRHSGNMNTLWADGHTSKTKYSGDASSGWNERGNGTDFNFRSWTALNN